MLVKARRYVILQLLLLLVKFQESNQQFRNRFVVITSGLETMVRIMVLKSELVISHSTSSFILTRSRPNTHALTALPHFHLLALKESVEQ